MAMLHGYCEQCEAKVHEWLDEQTALFECGTVSSLKIEDEQLLQSLESRECLRRQRDILQIKLQERAQTSLPHIKSQRNIMKSLRKNEVNLNGKKIDEVVSDIIAEYKQFKEIFDSPNETSSLMSEVTAARDYIDEINQGFFRPRLLEKTLKRKYDTVRDRNTKLDVCNCLHCGDFKFVCGNCGGIIDKREKTCITCNTRVAEENHHPTPCPRCDLNQKQSKQGKMNNH